MFRGDFSPGSLTRADIKAAISASTRSTASSPGSLFVVAAEGYGLPVAIGEAFSLLEKDGVIDATLAEKLRKMVGFRNIAVHDYQTIDPRVVESIVSTRLDDLRVFAAKVAERFGVG
jgi:hypothetical protein